jgi:starch synthase
MSPIDSLRVLFIASEADPFVKVGGLGDVAGWLPPAIHNLSSSSATGEKLPGGEKTGKIDIRLVIPLHGAIRRQDFDLQPILSLSVPHKDGPIPAEIWTCQHQGVQVYLIGGPPLPPDEPVYSNDNLQDGIKFTFFSLAVLKMAHALHWQPHLLHANDWHTAPAIYALSLNRSNDPFLAHTATLLTVHNLPYLGAGAELALAGFGLSPAVDSPLPWWAQDLPLPLGLLTTDHIVTVSPTYAREILTPEFGSGLYDFLRTRTESISGILNGIDLERWNPETDHCLAARFGLDSLNDRRANKVALQEEFGLEQDPSIPLLTMITRLDNQKGVDLALEGLRQLASSPEAVQEPWQAILLGTGIPSLEENARQMEAAFPNRLRAAIRFDAELSRRLYGGADALLLPSRYEPCGLAQMIGMRYGCVPIARATGGLRDTILDNDHQGASTGFLFTEPSPEALSNGLRRALAVYRDQKRWATLQRNGMLQDFSWTRSAYQYAALYRQLVNARQAPSSAGV